ncbi:hypothetical protein FSARC_489 [Fusarium sarcochroum]|uniref:Fungal-specific transcription factor domain-containing protein n=1 Tax=Fusarium sarcochroum TaxID=1208366 RepID=A0A8H4XG34_9HYPO|nr:hypothetical protein FSARC_489 [Fusarium sarcochroum]
MPSIGPCSPTLVSPVTGSVNSYPESSSTRDILQDDIPRVTPEPSDVLPGWLSDLTALPSPLTSGLETSQAGSSHFIDNTSDFINTRSQGSIDMQQVIVRSGLDLSTQRSHVPKTIHIDLFGNSEIDKSMSHYNEHVADLLLPIDHSANPFRNLYLSTALKGVACLNLNITPLGSVVYSALSNSLIATSAFHIWNQNRDQAKYREIGVRYRYCAIQALRIAMRETGPGPDYRVLVMVMLCLVTIGVMSGQDDDFRMHLDAVREWRETRSRWKLLSHSTRQLGEIGSFLSLLARTFEFRPSAASWPYNISSLEQEVIESSSCYEYMYGVTPAIAGAIHQACNLAEHLSRFRDVGQDLPEDFLEACEELGNKLESWHFENENTTSIPKEDELRYLLLACQAKAWHAAALIYYFYRIHGTPSEQLMQEVDCVLDNLNAAEELKPVSDKATMAPFTWPGLIASLTTTKPNRHLWAAWWQKMARYRIANIDKQWGLIQQIWGIMDHEEVEGKGRRNWIEVFTELGIHLLPA